MLGGFGASRFCSNPAARIAYALVLIKRALGFLLLQLKSNHYKNVMGLSDLTIFVVRYGYTDKALLNFIKDIDQAGKIKNIVTVLNGISRNNTYGYGYNYSYNNYGYKNSN